MHITSSARFVPVPAHDAADANDLVTWVKTKAVVAADVTAGRLCNALDKRGFARHACGA